MRLLAITGLVLVGCSAAKTHAPTVEQAKALMVVLGMPCEDKTDVLKCTSPEGTPRSSGFVNLAASDHAKVSSIEIYLEDTTVERATPLLLAALGPYLPAGAWDGITTRLATPHGTRFTIEKVEILAEKWSTSGVGVHVQIDYWDR